MLRRNAALPFLPSLLLVACGSGSGGGDDAPPTASMLVPDVRAALVAAGVTELPPTPVVRDELFELGQALFFDKLLSGNLDVSCATCHLPEFAGSDGRTLASGVDGIGEGPLRGGGAIVPRNSLTVLDAHLLTALFADGRVEPDGLGGVDTPAGAELSASMQAVFEPGLELLAAQAMFPVTERLEMRGDVGESELGDLADGAFVDIWDALMERLLMNSTYASMFAAAYPSTAMVDLNFAHAANAIAGFEARAFARTDSPFERFVGGDDLALAENELMGALEFYGGGGCGVCHFGNTFTDGAFHNIALPQFGPGKGNGPGGNDDFGRENVEGLMTDRYRFRTAPLLNVALTAPYGHAGQFATLDGIVRHYLDTEFSLRFYDIVANVDDPALLGTLVPNTNELLATVSTRVADPRTFDVAAVVDFLETLTADSARDLSDVVPTSVPSGLPID